MSLENSLLKLYSLERLGIKLGLEPIIKLFDYFNNPQNNFPTIHVAGTNGKGSVSAFIASVLSESGLKVGLYSSPHLNQFNERIRINGIPISDDILLNYSNDMLSVIEDFGCTFFEGTTAIAFKYFSDNKVDVAIIETGLGGRLDATNVITPLISVVTSIGLDHQKFLGDTLYKIAKEKAGIIKYKTPVVLGNIDVKLNYIFEDASIENHSELFLSEKLCSASNVTFMEDCLIADFTFKNIFFDNLQIGLTGYYQLDNVKTALTSLIILQNKFNISEKDFFNGFFNVKNNTGISSRFDSRLFKGKKFLFDVAHNAHGALALVNSLQLLYPNNKFNFIFGSVIDKDHNGIIDIISQLTNKLIVCKAFNYRSVETSYLKSISEKYYIETIESKSVNNAIEIALNLTESNLTIIFGSFYVVAEALEYFK